MTSAPIMTSPRSVSQPIRTLVVDDSVVVRTVIERILNADPHYCVVNKSSSAEQALAFLADNKVDLVLLDMTMPELDGLGVARHFAAQPQAPVVIFVTAHDHFAVEAFDLEAVDYVLKPVSADRLERAIERAVARRGQRRQKAGRYLDELWVPHRSELLRIAVSEVHQIDAERDYVRLQGGAGAFTYGSEKGESKPATAHVPGLAQNSYGFLLQADPVRLDHISQ